MSKSGSFFLPKNRGDGDGGVDLFPSFWYQQSASEVTAGGDTIKRGMTDER
jgi:hypothetical protein